MKGVDAEQSRRQKTGPVATCHGHKKEKKKQRVHQVKHQAGLVVAPGIETKELYIEHMREPCQGMPIAGMSGCKGPDKAFESQAGLHVMITGEVLNVVVADEVIMLHLPENGNGGDSQKEICEEVAAHSGYNNLDLSMYIITRCLLSISLTSSFFERMNNLPFG